MQNEMKPCPFCGSVSLKLEIKNIGSWDWTKRLNAVVRCHKCHARGGTAIVHESSSLDVAKEKVTQLAVAKWNRRVKNAERNER